MKKVYVQVVDTKNNICQHGKIEEPITEGFEVLNALKHFGVDAVNWISEETSFSVEVKFGEVVATTKVVSVIILS